jgi:hypothetical protein
MTAVQGKGRSGIVGGEPYSDSNPRVGVGAEVHHIGGFGGRPPG